MANAPCPSLEPSAYGASAAASAPAAACAASAASTPVSAAFPAAVSAAVSAPFWRSREAAEGMPSLTASVASCLRRGAGLGRVRLPTPLHCGAALSSPLAVGRSCS